MYMCVKGLDFASFCEFSIGLWNCSDSVAFIILLHTQISTTMIFKQNQCDVIRDQSYTYT